MNSYHHTRKFIIFFFNVMFLFAVTGFCVNSQAYAGSNDNSRVQQVSTSAPTVTNETENWKTYRLGEAGFALPVDWKIKRRSRNRDYVLKSPDGAYRIDISWWFPDEPVLSSSHIIKHKKITVAGKTATWVYSRIRNNQDIMVVFDEARNDKRKLLILLEFNTQGFEKSSRLLDLILSRMTYGKKKTPLPGYGRKLPPKTTSTSGTSDGGELEMLYDGQGSFSIKRPSKWRLNTADRDDTHIVTLTPNDKSALVVIVSKRAPSEKTFEKIFSNFETVLYQDSFLPDSIDDDRELTIGNMKARLIAYSGEIYSVEGVRLAFNTGVMRRYTMRNGDLAYALYVLYSSSAPSALQSRLDTMVASFNSRKTPPQTGSDPVLQDNFDILKN